MHTLRYISLLLLLTITSVSGQSSWEHDDGAEQHVVQHRAKEASLEIYPNPTADYVFVRTEQRTASYVLTNLIGKTISMGIIDNSQAIIDLTNNHKGIYILKIFDQDQRRITTRKIIKE